MSDETKRLFISIPVSAHVRSCLASYMSSNEQMNHVRWVPEENLHSTVLFLGPVRNEQYVALVEKVRVLLSTVPSFELTAQTVAYASITPAYKMVWLYWEPLPSLAQLADTLCQSLVQIGVVPGDSFKGKGGASTPHTTLGKVQRDTPDESLVQLSPIGIEGQCMNVEVIELVESTLTPGGSQFEVLEKFSLVRRDK